MGLRSRLQAGKVEPWSAIPTPQPPTLSFTGVKGGCLHTVQHPKLLEMKGGLFVRKTHFFSPFSPSSDLWPTQSVTSTLGEARAVAHMDPKAQYLSKPWTYRLFQPLPVLLADVSCLYLMHMLFIVLQSKQNAEYMLPS